METPNSETSDFQTKVPLKYCQTCGSSFIDYDFLQSFSQTVGAQVAPFQQMALQRCFAELVQLQIDRGCRRCIPEDSGGEK